jgi:hypothetical protein
VLILEGPDVESQTKASSQFGKIDKGMERTRPRGDVCERPEEEGEGRCEARREAARRKRRKREEDEDEAEDEGE